ncbi:hypothetical protein A9K97_gp202 [Tokyovirus A1]|uniref:hypothetical protein n=1 Tax=Tokyovirus A1 TaxID=1826170 RepID=UPI0007A97239|nr:hypothetical protein A9K97_gp202 [Tokyovirus A1]BAU80149.1 hypothetical protein [Tokyovirus A1]
MSLDFDSVGYWVKGMPYVWVPSQKLKECKRYYFINGNMGAYDAENRLSNQAHWTRFVVSSEGLLDIDLFIVPCKDSWVKNFFGVFPFDTRSWRISEKGKFLVSPPPRMGSWIPESEWSATEKGFEFRMEGKRVEVVPGVPEERIFADLLLPSQRVLEKFVVFPPGKFSLSLSHPIFGFSEEDAAVRSKKTGEKFTTITSLASKENISLEGKKKLHERCLGKEEDFEYRYIFFDETNQTKREKMRVAADWVNDVWSGKIQWGGPPGADVELFEHAPYKDTNSLVH